VNGRLYTHERRTASYRSTMFVSLRPATISLLP
jgi:hypothetical protein